MDAKTPKTRRTKPATRYAPEDLTPRDPAADEAAVDAYIARNKDALNASIRRAKAEFERGEHFTRKQVAAAIAAQRQRRKHRKA